MHTLNHRIVSLRDPILSPDRRLDRETADLLDTGDLAGEAGECREWVSE